MTTTADKASGNGATTTSKRVPAQREHGLKRLREDQCYQPVRPDRGLPQRG